MLNQVLKTLDSALLQHAVDAIGRPLDPAVAAFEFGRRQGIYQGLQIARSRVEELMKGDEDDERSSDGETIRRRFA